MAKTSPGTDEALRRLATRARVAERECEGLRAMLEASRKETDAQIEAAMMWQRCAYKLKDLIDQLARMPAPDPDAAEEVAKVWRASGAIMESRD